MLKDVAGDLPVKSLIFDHKDFERLEHEGWQEIGGRIERLRETLSRIKVQAGWRREWRDSIKAAA